MKLSLDKFFGINSLIKVVELQKKLAEKHFSLKDTGLTQIVIHNWDAHGLLLSGRENKEKWRKYDVVEFIWLKVLKALRDIGVPLSVLQKYRKELFYSLPAHWIGDYLRQNADLIENPSLENYKDEILKALDEINHDGTSKDENVSWFHLLLMETLVNKTPLGIAFFHDGHWLPRNPAGYEIWSPDQTERLTFETYVYVSLAGIVRDFLCEVSFDVLPTLNILEKNELKVLEMIHSGEYESVTINFKSRKMKSMLLVKNQDTKRKVVDVLRDSAYQDIVIKTHEGMVTKIQNTVKVMLD